MHIYVCVWAVYRCVCVYWKDVMEPVERVEEYKVLEQDRWIFHQFSRPIRSRLDQGQLAHESNTE